MKKRTSADDSGCMNDRFNNAPSVEGYLVSDNANVKGEIVFDEPRAGFLNGLVVGPGINYTGPREFVILVF